MYKYPIVGYVDSSAAKDVVNMLFYLNNPASASNQPDNKTESSESPVKIISDARILENYISKNILKDKMQWGDRTCAFICDRNDLIYKQYPEQVKSRIAFFYIKLSSVSLSRVEFPEWCLEFPGMVENIAHIMRIESIIGSGYPYTIDQCHHRCVINGEDRMKFLRLFQDFGQKNGLKIKIKNKSRSKMVRS
jgi:hypothetical protein